MSPVMRCHFGIGVDISWNVNQMALYSLGVVSCGGGGTWGREGVPNFRFPIWNLPNGGLHLGYSALYHLRLFRHPKLLRWGRKGWMSLWLQK